MNIRCLCPLCCTSKNRESLPAVCRCSSCPANSTPPPSVTAVSSPSHLPKPTHLPARLYRQAYETKLFKVEILLIRIAYCTKRITWLFWVFFFVPSCQSKEVMVTHHTVFYSLSSYCFTVLIDRLSFDLSIRNASFYIVPNDDQWNACAVSWINKPLKHVSHGISFSQMLHCAVSQCRSVMLPTACFSEDPIWQLCLSFCEPVQRLASLQHLYGEISYCAFISLFCKNRQPDKKPTDWM